MIWESYNSFGPLRLVYFAVERPASFESLSTPKVSDGEIPSYPINDATREFGASKERMSAPVLKSGEPGFERAEGFAIVMVKRIAPSAESQDSFLAQLDTDLDVDAEIRPAVLDLLGSIEERFTLEESTGTEDTTISATAVIDLGPGTEISADASVSAQRGEDIDFEADHLFGLSLTGTMDRGIVSSAGIRGEFQIVDGKLNISGIYGSIDFADNLTSIGIGVVPSDTQILSEVSLSVSRGGFSGSFSVDPKTGSFQGEIGYEIKF